MATKPTGKRPGALCPGCKEEQLVVRTNDPTIGDEVGGLYSCRSVVTHLVCRSCSGMYEAVDRGKDVGAILREQIKGFENPGEPPTECRECGGSITDQTIGEQDDCLIMRCRACEECLTVAWVFPKETRREISEFPKYSGRRMPSPPLTGPSRRKRRG